MSERRRYAVRFDTDSPELMPVVLAEGWVTPPKFQVGETLEAPGADGTMTRVRVVAVHKDGSFDAEAVQS